MLEAIAFYSQGPDSYFQYRCFSHNDNCSHDEQGALSASQEQQIRQMVWEGRGGHFRNVRCKEDAGSNQARHRRFPFFRLHPTGMTRAGQMLLLQRQSYMSSDEHCGLAQRIFTGIFAGFFFTHNISPTSLWKYMLKQKSVGAGPARPVFHSGTRNHRHKPPVVSLREFIGLDSVAAAKLSRKTLALE